MRKDKANLSRETCYELLSKHKEAFVLAQRWKLSGRDWLDLSVKRLREGFFASACQVIEYNLLKMADIEHFHSQKHHE